MNLQETIVADNKNKSGGESNDFRHITALPVQHSIPGNGYWIDSGEGTLVFSGYTGSVPQFWQAVNQMHEDKKGIQGGKQPEDFNYLRHLIIETSFTNAEAGLAKLSGHYHPAQLASDLQSLDTPCSVWITHLKPGFTDTIMAELHQDFKAMSNNANNSAQTLKNAQVLVF